MYYFKQPPDNQLPSVIIYDQTGKEQPHIRNQLALYKKRWGESIADKVMVVHTPEHFIPGVPIIASEYMAATMAGSMCEIHSVPTISLMTHYHLRAAVIEVSFEWTDDLDQALKWLNSLTDTFTADFETSSKYDEEEKEFIQQQIDKLDPISDQAEIIELQQQMDSSGLSHPSLTDLTHLVIGLSESQSYVIVLTEANTKPVLDFLVQTHLKQIWHNLSFDAKHILHHTGYFPKNYEDTQLLAWAYINHANTFQAKVGLKGLAGKIYGDWAVSGDSFTPEMKYDPDLIRYAAIDGMATWFVWNEFSNEENIDDIEITEDILPVGNTSDPDTYKTPRYFYENVMKPSIPDMVEMMMQGIAINSEEVENLRNTVENVLETVKQRLAANKLIQEYLEKKYAGAKSKYKDDRESHLKQIDYYLKPLDITKMDHRSYLVEHLLSTRIGINTENKPTAQLPDGSPKWAAKDVKQLIKDNSENERFCTMMQKIIDKNINPETKNCKDAMEKLAVKRTSLYNKKFNDQIKGISKTTIPGYTHAFNPNSPKQKIELFEMLDLESEETTKTGNPSWNRAQVERVNKETNNPEIEDFTQSIIDFSFSAIIRNNFLRAFDRFVVDGTLYGNVKLAGAKSYRLTSNAP